MMRRLILVVSIVLLFAGVVSADPVTLSGNGTLSFACDSCFADLLGIRASAGDPFTFSLSFASVSPDQLMDASLGGYSLGGGSFTVGSGAGTFTGPSQVAGFVQNVSPPAPSGRPDLITVRAVSAESPFLAVVIQGVDRRGNWLSSDAWPSTVAAVLNAAPETFFYLFDQRENDGGGSFVAGGPPLRITQELTPAPVPEPSTLLLLGTGLLGAMTMRRWRRREA